MKTLIVYATKYGCTKECAKMLAVKLIGEVQLHNLKQGIPAIEGYEKVVVGGSVYIGQIGKEVTQFLKEKENELKSKELGLFIVCMREGELAEQQLSTVYPQELLKHAKVKGLFGGQFKFGKMSFMDKLITRVIAKTSEDVSNIHCENIKGFAETLNGLDEATS